MPNTYSQLYIQIVFAVQGRKNLIKESFREELQKYASGIIHNKKQKLFAIDFRPDHAHVFVSIQPDKSVSALVSEIKSNTSSFVKQKTKLDFSWQTGFGAFSYSKSQAPSVVNYILNQHEHHKIKTFREEYLELLKEFDVEFDHRFLFEFYE